MIDQLTPEKINTLIANKLSQSYLKKLIFTNPKYIQTIPLSPGMFNNSAFETFTKTLTISTLDIEKQITKWLDKIFVMKRPCYLLSPGITLQATKENNKLVITCTFKFWISENKK